jgi:hypothetical protein
MSTVVQIIYGIGIMVTGFGLGAMTYAPDRRGRRIGNRYSAVGVVVIVVGSVLKLLGHS